MLIAGALSADLISGLVHWTADTWGSEAMPFLGRRFVRPFRVHHVNPDDFLRRRFLDTNGDVAMLTIPFLLIAHALPLNTVIGHSVAAFLAAFSFVVLPTNQVHQWAHRTHPPRMVRSLQNCGLILSRRAHSRHHCAPYARNYCIATGWCNPILERIQFFRRLEQIVSAVTGLQAREDDAGFQHAVESGRVCHDFQREANDG
jgi:ubiquitin-conjugating enzyme E2 variant